MKQILRSYSLGFILLFVIFTIKGAISEISAKSPQVFRNISTQSRGSLEFQCGDGPTFLWNIDKNKLTIQDPNMDLMFSNIPGFDPFTLKKTSDVIFAFLGGASASYKMNDIHQIIKSKGLRIRKYKKILGIFAGALSGYTLGEWVGSYWLIGCDSDSVVNFVREEKNWLDIEKTMGSLNLTRAISYCEKNDKSLYEQFVKYKENNKRDIMETEKKIKELYSMSRDQYYEGRDEPNSTIFLDRFDVDEYLWRIPNCKSRLYFLKKREKIMEVSPQEFISKLENINKFDFKKSDFDYIKLLYNVCTCEN